MQVESRLGQENLPGHGGQVHVRTRPLNRVEFFDDLSGLSRLCFTMKSAGPWQIPVYNNQTCFKFQITTTTFLLSGKCLLRGDWFHQCSDRLGVPAGRSRVISDKNAQNSTILGSNIYGDYPGSLVTTGEGKGFAGIFLL